ncbi:unnamed protein product [Closterium sp. NIES-64]|nr:unnamed protein product [Closterium sp. NIES-64]
MATPSVLAFDAEGRAIDFEVWVDDLQLFLQCDRADGLSLFDLTSGASPAPAADADPTFRSQWATRDDAARLAVRRHLPTTERAHFSQYKSAQTFDTRYRAALPAEFCAKNPPPMYITLYYIVTRLPDSLRVVRDHFLSVCPTTLTVDLLEKALLAAEKSIVAVGASRGDPRTPIFEGRSVRRLPLAGDTALARARGARARVELAGAVEVAVEAAEGVGVAVGVVAGVEVSVAAVEAEAAESAAVLAEAAVVAEVEEAVVEEVAVVGVALRSGAALVVVSASSSSSSSVLGTFPPLSSSVSGTRSVSVRCFGRLTDAWRQQFPEASEIPRWRELSRAGVAIYDLDFDAILAAMYAVTISDEGDCYRCFPPDPGIGTAALGAGEAAALGASASAPSGAGESALSGTKSASASLTFTLDSGASRSFFRDRTTLAPLGRPVAVSLAAPLWHLVWSLPPLVSLRTCQVAASGPGPSYVPCVEGRLRAAPHSSQFPPTEDPLQTLHMDVWGPARVRGQGHERYFVLVVDDYSRYTSVFPLRSKGDLTEVLIDWIRAARLQLRRSFGSDFPVLRLHSDRGGEFSSGLLRAYCRARGIRQTFTASGLSTAKMGLLSAALAWSWTFARTSMMHVAAPHFLWPFAVRYAVHQINLQPQGLHAGDLPSSAVDEEGRRMRLRSVSGDLGRLSATCLRTNYPLVLLLVSSLASPLTHQGGSSTTPPLVVFLSSQDVTFDESVPYYRLFPYRTPSLPPPPHFLVPGPPPGRPPPPEGPTPSGVSQVDAVEPVEVAGDSGTAAGAEPGGADYGGAARVGAEPGAAEPGGAASGAAEPGGTESVAAEPGGAEPAAAGPARVASSGAGPGGSPGCFVSAGATPLHRSCASGLPGLEAYCWSCVSSAAELAGAAGLWRC